jgi:hypothetical protein
MALLLGSLYLKHCLSNLGDGAFALVNRPGPDAGENRMIELGGGKR